MTRSSPSSPTPDPSRCRLAGLSEMVRRRADARRGPGAFLEYCFADPQGRPVRQAAVHHELQAFLSVHPKALVELPRDHGKTLQVCGRILWELGRNPGLRVKVVCATDDVAAQRARFLRDAVATNPRVRQVFPGLVPGKPWAADAFTVARPADVVGSSVAAFGVGCGSTGTRADLLVCDDVVDVRALVSRTERERVTAFFHDNLLNLLEPDGRFWGLFTPWHPEDLNAVLKRNPSFAVFRRAVGPDLEPVWEEKWPREKLAQRRAEVGAAGFARGYHLNPVNESETPVKPGWVRFWTTPAVYECVALSVDPAVTASGRADASALVVLGRLPADRGEGVVHVLEASARRVTAPDLVGLIDDAAGRWNPDVVLFESNAAFAGIKDLLVRHARFGPRVRGVVQTRDKGSRLSALGVPVSNGSVRLKGGAFGGVDAGQRELFEELTTFPFAPHDDLADALATGAMWLLDRREPRAW